jgi:NAD(P)-dependent dehydrogenase (short-subunit alcohol dehydrogenase family)
MLVINTSFESGAYMLPNFFAYTVSTTAPIRFTESLAAELKRHGVRS